MITSTLLMHRKWDTGNMMREARGGREERKWPPSKTMASHWNLTKARKDTLDPENTPNRASPAGTYPSESGFGRQLSELQRTNLHCIRTLN